MPKRQAPSDECIESSKVLRRMLMRCECESGRDSDAWYHTIQIWPGRLLCKDACERCLAQAEGSLSRLETAGSLAQLPSTQSRRDLFYLTAGSWAPSTQSGGRGSTWKRCTGARACGGNVGWCAPQSRTPPRLAAALGVSTGERMPRSGFELGPQLRQSGVGTEQAICLLSGYERPPPPSTRVSD